MAYTLGTIYRDITKRLKGHIDKLYDIVNIVQERPRAKRNWFGKAVSWATGLVEEDELTSVKQTMQRVLQVTENRSLVWQSATHNLVAAMKIQSEQISNIFNILQLHRESTQSIYDALSTVEAYDEMKFNMLMFLIQKMSQAMFHLNDVDLLVNALSDSVIYGLNPLLISEIFFGKV